MKYRITVLIGIYNCATTLREALDSLLNQSFKDFKVVLCNDGSIDNTHKIAEEYAIKYSNFILIQNEHNMGLNYTLNHCLEYADTEYVARMDGDDVSLPTRFEKEVSFLDSHPEFAFVSTPMLYFDEDGVFRAGHAIEYPQKKDFVFGTPFCHAASMCRTAVIKDVGGYSVDDHLLRVEDYHLWMKIYAAGYKGYNIQEPLYKMRDDRNALLRRNWKNRKNEIYVRRIGFKMLKLPWYTQIFTLRPFIAHIVPSWLYKLYHRR